jgi:DNA (cytosine-5)-methyltransferase 1
MLLLDLFCGGGGASWGYHQAGFDVIGVDSRPQPLYPFEFHQMDAMDALSRLRGDEAVFEGKKVDLIHLSPPCKAHTRAKHIREAQGRQSSEPNLLTPSLRMLEDVRTPWIVENVPGAPMRKELELCGSMFGLKVRRHRWFCAHQDLFLYPPGVCDHVTQGKPVGVYHTMNDTVQGKDNERGGYVIGGSTAKTLEEGQEAMGIDWLTWKPLTQAIPPAYTKFIGGILMRQLLPDR